MKVCKRIGNRFRPFEKEVYHMAKFCSNCGTPLGENQKFCTECGAPVAQQPISQPPQNTPPQPQTYYGQQQTACQQPPNTYQPPQNTYNTYRQPTPHTYEQPQTQRGSAKLPVQKKKKKGKAWLVILILLLLGAAGYFGFRDGGWFRKSRVTYSETAMTSIRDYARKLEESGNTAAAEAVYEALAGAGAELIDEAHNNIPIIAATDEASQFEAFANTVKGGGR